MHYRLYSLIFLQNYRNYDILSSISFKNVDISEKRCIEMAEEDEFSLGSVVCAHVEGWPWLPGLVILYTLTSFQPKHGRAPANDAEKRSVESSSDGRISVLDPSAIS